MVIDKDGTVKNNYTYEPFGELIATECTETTENSFKFTGQFYDSEIGQYYLRARQYDPQLMRFTARDPVAGKFEEPMSLHVYLYCLNNPVNMLDPSGLWGGYTHKTIIEWVFRYKALPGYKFTKDGSPIDLINRGSGDVDARYGINTEADFPYAPYHGMCAPGMSKEAAMEKMDNFVTQHLKEYLTDLLLEEYDSAYTHLGMALHSVMDVACPVHAWNELNPAPYDSNPAWQRHKRYESKLDTTLRNNNWINYDYEDALEDPVLQDYSTELKNAVKNVQKTWSAWGWE